MKLPFGASLALLGGAVLLLSSSAPVASAVDPCLSVFWECKGKTAKFVPDVRRIKGEKIIHLFHQQIHFFIYFDKEHFFSARCKEREKEIYYLFYIIIFAKGRFLTEQFLYSSFDHILYFIIYMLLFPY